MDLFDLIPIQPGGAARGRTKAESLAANLVCFVLPAIDVCLLLLLDLGRHPMVAGVWLPLALAGLGVLVCRRLRIGTVYTVYLALGCMGLCMLFGAAAIFLAVFSLMF